MFIYQITNLVNNRIYIGRCKRNTINQLLIRYRYECKKFVYRPIILAINKYGFENFKFEIIENNIENYEKLIQQETYWITKLDSCNKGYNCNYGNDGGNHQIFTYEQRYGKTKAKKLKLRLSLSHKNLPSNMKGKKHTLETIENIKQTIKDKWQDKKYKSKLLKIRNTEKYKNQFRGLNNPRAVQFEIKYPDKTIILDNIKGLKEFCIANLIKFKPFYAKLKEKRKDISYNDFIIGYL